MASVWTHSVLLSRGQIAEISGVPAGTLAFWLKNGLLIPASGGDGRGNHKKFKPVQATLAAIFGALQKFGMNIGMLKGFSQTLQRGVFVGESTKLHPASLKEAIALRKRVLKFENGEPISLYYSSLNERDDVKDYPIARSVEEIENDYLNYRPDYDIVEDIIEFSRCLVPDDFTGLSAYSEIRMEMDGFDWADPSWIIWQSQDGHWEISSQSEPGEQFSKHPDTEAAIFLAVGAIIRRVWALDLREIRMERLRRRIPEYRRTNPHIAATMTAQLRALEEGLGDD